MVGIDADAPLGRTLGERRLDPGTARLVLDYHERVGLARLLIEHVKTGDKPGNGLDRVAQVLDVGVLWVGWLGVESGRRASIGPSWECWVNFLQCYCREVG